MTAIRVLHFSDILCVWAYVGQIRIDELSETFGDRIDVRMHCCPVFGVARDRLAEGWKDRGGLSGYARHVRDVVADFDHVAIHPDVWSKVSPPSSLPCHLFLHAARIASGEAGARSETMRRVAWALRRAFFQDARPVCERGTQLEIARELELDAAAIEAVLDCGEAHAALASDDTLVRDYDVRTSPTLIFNEGRQRLVGNVGYRVIEANVRELLDRPEGARSWC